MGIFARLATLIKSNLNDLISRSEDPEKMLNQVVLDMNTQLIEAKKQVASSIADEKRLQKQLQVRELLRQMRQRQLRMLQRGRLWLQFLQRETRQGDRRPRAPVRWTQ